MWYDKKKTERLWGAAMDILTIGIAGGTGSGKTTITKRIMERFGSDVSVIYHDNYYKAHNGMSYEEAQLRPPGRFRDGPAHPGPPGPEARQERAVPGV